MSRARQLLPLLLVGACAEPAKNTIDVPSFGTEYVFFAAAAGRALGPRDLQIVRAAELTSFEVPGEGLAEVEVVVAGLDPAALPAEVAVEDLEFVSAVTPGSRPPPPLVEPRILSEPVPPGAVGALVPVDEAGVSDSIRGARRLRFEALFANLAIVDPCRPLPISRPLSLPRTRAEALGAMSILSNGEIAIATPATSTAMFALLSANDDRFTEVGVETGTTTEGVIQAGERATLVAHLGEVELPSGRRGPRSFALTRGGVLGHVGTFDPTRRRYVDVTPRTLARSLGPLTGIAEVVVDGQDHLCVYGAVANSCRAGAGLCEAAVWCQAQTSTVWRTIGHAPRSMSITALVALPGRPLYATSRVGGLLFDRGRDEPWRELARTPDNQDPRCILGCYPLDTVIPADPASGAPAVVAGHHAKAYVVDTGAGGEGQFRPISVLDEALFGDERTDGARVFSIDAAGRDPSGALWFGTPHQRLIRVSPDLSRAERWCLPDDAAGLSVGALAFRPDGRLVLGFRPAALVVGSWQTP